MRYLLLCATFLIAGAAPSFAASGGDTTGFMSGLLHPILGFDHLLAMVAVGLLSTQLGGKHIWYLPAAFVAFLMVGGLIGLQEIGLPQVEGVISASVLLLGIAIAMGGIISVYMAYPIVAFFAIFHGHAHGMEVPSINEASQYVIGFMIASAFLHLVGVAIGAYTKSTLRAHLGSAMAGVGGYLLLLIYGVV